MSWMQFSWWDAQKIVQDVMQQAALKISEATNKFILKTWIN